MAFRRFLGLGTDDAGRPTANQATERAETATVRAIMAKLSELDPERRRYLAGFAYLLSRAAHADLAVSGDEIGMMERIVRDIGGLPETQAVLVVEIARNQSELYGGTEDFLVTREFAARATPEQRRAAVEACFAVVAVDHTITPEEYSELTQIANELDLSREELNVIRREYSDHMSAIQKMRRLAGGTEGAG
jgi:uncharacterized tellurite resistance protein B-like protein